MQEPISIFTGTSNRPLAEKVCYELTLLTGKPIGLSRAYVGRFNDGEVAVRLGVDTFDQERSLDEVRGRDVFVVQSTQPPAEYFFELFLLADAICRRSPRRITLVIPYLGYTRQDRKDKSGKPISASVVARTVESAFLKGIPIKVVLVDVHSEQIEGFFNVPVDRLYASYVFIPVIRELNLGEITFVAADFGAAEQNRFYARRLRQRDIALIDKRRPEAGELEVLNVIGKVGRTAIFRDDMIDTGRTLGEGAKAIIIQGEKEIFDFCTHAVLSGPALQNLMDSPAKVLYVTDSIPLSPEAQQCSKIKVVSIAPMLAAAIQRIHNEESVSSLIYQ